MGIQEFSTPEYFFDAARISAEPPKRLGALGSIDRWSEAILMRSVMNCMQIYTSIKDFAGSPVLVFLFRSLSVPLSLLPVLCLSLSLSVLPPSFSLPPLSGDTGEETGIGVFWLHANYL